jgi:hypothetical protein
MNHEDAAKSMTAERYTLGELEPSERDAFEEHFFECSACADDVRDEARFATGVRTAGARVIPHTGRFNWWAVAASVLAAGLGYQTLVVIPQMATRRITPVESARVLAAQPLAAESRGSGETVVIARADEPVHLELPFVADTPGPHRGEIRDARGHQVGQSFAVPETMDTVPLFVPSGILRSGKYTLVIRGASGHEVTTYRFEVRPR